MNCLDHGIGTDKGNSILTKGDCGRWWLKKQTLAQGEEMLENNFESRNPL